MRILLVAATQQEIGLLISNLGFSISDFVENGVNRSSIQLTTHNSQLTILITGVGMVATAFELGRHLTLHQYDLAINLGIAGSFDKNITLGDVVEIVEDTLSELGAEDAEQFLSIDEMGFGESGFKPTTTLAKYGDFNLKQVKAITVNMVHGHEPSIKKLSNRMQPQLESMEGAAFFFACKQVNIPCLQIRAVSNYVEKRNRDNWQIGLAIKNLNIFVLQFLRNIERTT